MDYIWGMQKGVSEVYRWPKKMEEWDCHLLWQSLMHIMLNGGDLCHEKWSLKFL